MDWAANNIDKFGEENLKDAFNKHEKGEYLNDNKDYKDKIKSKLLLLIVLDDVLGQCRDLHEELNLKLACHAWTCVWDIMGYHRSSISYSGKSCLRQAPQKLFG